MFSFQSVIFLLLFIVMFFLPHFIGHLEFKFWLYFIIIYDFYYMNDDIIDAISKILIMSIIIVTLSNIDTVSLFLFRTLVLYHRHCCCLFLLSFLYVLSLWKSLSTRFDHWLHWKYIYGRWYYLYTCHVCFSLSTIVSYNHHRCWFSFLSFLFFILHRWVQPLIRIIDYLGSTQLWNNISAIYSVCFYPTTMALYHIHCWWLLLFVKFPLFPPLK